MEQLIHSLKTAIACSCAYLLAVAVGQPADQWIVISTIVVMSAQIYVGSILHKSYLRLLGTLLGCLTATATILLFPHSFATTLATIAFAGFLFSFIATSNENLSQMGTLGAVTTIIILFGHPPSLTFAVMRFMEISLGIVIATLVSQFIFPIHARTHLRRAQATTLRQIRDYYTAVIMQRFSEEDIANRNELDEIIVKSLLKQRQLAREAAPELIGKRFDPQHFARSLYSEREILRDINFMDIALSKIGELRTIYTDQNPLTPFSNAIVKALDILTSVMRTNQPGETPIHLPAITSLTNALHQYPHLTTADHRIYVNGFVFSAEVLVTSLRELALLYKIPMLDETPKE